MGHRSQTHCPHGHAFTPANTQWVHRKTGVVHRRCKACHAEGTKMWRVYKRDVKDDWHTQMEKEKACKSN